MRVARPHFARIGNISEKMSRQANRPYELIRSQLASVYNRYEKCCRGPGARRAPKPESDRHRSQQRGKGIGRRRRIDDVAAQRSPILVGDAAGPARRARQQWKFLAENGMLSQIGVRTARANLNFLLQRRRSAATREDSTRLTSFRAASLPEAYCTIRSVPPAMGSHCARLPRQQRQDCRQIAGRTQLVIGRIRSHVCTLACRAASATASKICTYPVQRQRLPDSPSRISSIVGCGFLLNR